MQRTGNPWGGTHKRAGLILALVLVSSTLTLAVMYYVNGVTSPSHSLTQYVNPFIGTSPAETHLGFNVDGRNTFPGATYQMGMVQWSPDTTSSIPAGYSDSDTTSKVLRWTLYRERG